MTLLSILHEDCSGEQSSDLRGAALPTALRVLEPEKVKGCGLLLFDSLAVSHHFLHANPRTALAVSRFTDREWSRRGDQAARPSIAVAASRRSTLPSGLRGTASTAHSRSGAL